MAGRIRILLCSWNGARWLPEQLNSYLAQEHRDWDLWVSDDGSSDGTLALLEAFRAEHGAGREIRILRGPGRGSTRNFLSLLCHPELGPGPVALSDQDDIWLPQKLTRAMAVVGDGTKTSLYGAQSLHVDEAGRMIGRSRGLRRPPEFRNALWQNMVSGHSAALSAGALELVRRAGVPEGLAYHDWWLYQLLTGAGAEVVIEEEPVLLYRQHGQNVMGAHLGLKARLERLRLVLGGGFGAWVAANLAALERVAPLLTPEHAALLARLRAAGARDGRAGTQRLALALREGLHRQSAAETQLFRLAAGLGRL